MGCLAVWFCRWVWRFWTYGLSGFVLLNLICRCGGLVGLLVYGCAVIRSGFGLVGYDIVFWLFGVWC